MGSDGEGVEVVGEDRPSGPDLHPVISFESGAAQAVAAFEVTDPALDRRFGSGLCVCGCVGCRVRGGRRAGSARRSRSGNASLVGPGWKPPSATISRSRIPARSSSAAVCGSSVFSAGFPELVPGGEDEPAGALAGVLGHLADLRDVPELGRFAELALADRPGVGVGDRHQPVGDLQPADATIDLLGDLAAAVGELLAACSAALQLRLGAAAAGEALAAAASRLASRAERAISRPACSLSAITCALASPVRLASVLEIARTVLPIDRDRSRTRTPCRRSARAACGPRARAPWRPARRASRRTGSGCRPRPPSSRSAPPAPGTASRAAPSRSPSW